ncbi:MAG: PKD domain-containing protein [Bacteroidia bacterium]|nr:PKD domain-containing protein [Bacteroidia bacterium]
MKKIALSIFFFFHFFAGFGQSDTIPTHYPGIQLWFRGDSVILNGSNVSVWKNKKGNTSRDGIQGTSANQPTYITGEKLLNNKSVLSFDGVNDYLACGTDLSIDSMRTVFVVFKEPAFNFYSMVLSKGYATDGAYVLGNNGSTQKVNMWVDNESNVFGSSPDIGTNWNIFTHTIAAGSNGVKLYKNSVLFGQYSPTADLKGSNTNELRVGNDPSNNYYFSGYVAEVLIYNVTLNDSARGQVELYLRSRYAPPVNIGPDINITNTFCDTVLKAGDRFLKYLWSTGDTTATINVNKSGQYSVKTTDVFGFDSYDTVNVSYPLINQLSDTTLCFGKTLIWNTLLPKNSYSFQWQDNSTDSLLTINQAGEYYVKITDGVSCSVISDTVRVTVDDFKSAISLGNDTTFCSGNTIGLKKGSSQVQSYLWTGGSVANFLTIASSGQYMVTVTNNNGCTVKDTINVTISGIAPKAGFSYISPGCKGDSISFTDLSIPPGGNTITGRLWSFGDAQNSSLANPKHLYLSPNDTGVFNVKLSVTTNVGCSKDTTIQLHVYPKPFVFFSNSLACSGDNVGFTNLSDLRGYAAQSYSWNFGDPASGANNTSSVASPGHKFIAPGVNNVKFVITNNKGCADSLVKSVTIQPAPTAQFSTSLTCEKQKIFFTDNSSIISPSVIQTWKTDFGDASSSTIKNPNHTYNIAWTYIVKYIVGANNGCSDTVIKPITIYNTPLAKIGLMGPFCVKDSIGFFDSSIVNSSSLNGWSWTIDGTQNFTVQDPKSPITNTGSHSAKLVVTSLEGCKDSTTRSFTINALPTVGFSFSPTYGDPPLVVSFTNLSAAGTSAWDFGDTFQSTLSSPTHTYQDSGTYVISLLLTDNNGCVNSSSQTFQLQYAKYDIALLEVQADIDADNFLNIKVNFGNASTRPLTAADFIVDIDGDNGFKESWAGNLGIGGISSYTFKTSPRLNTTSAHNYICVTAKKPNGFQDANPTDNEICIGLKSNEFILPEPSPNPASDYITIPLIIPSDAEVELIIYDKLGQAVSDRLKYSAIKGFNTIKYYTYNLGDGVYSYEITYKSAKAVKKFVKFRN